jgi:hypothetical protein
MSFIIQNMLHQVGNFVKKKCKRCGAILKKSDIGKNRCSNCPPKEKKGK